METELINQYIMHIFIHAIGKVQRKYAHGNIKPLSQIFRNVLYFISFYMISMEADIEIVLNPIQCMYEIYKCTGKQKCVSMPI
jgi:hypothetical protein